MSCIKLGFVIASVYAACRVLSVPRQLGEISEAVNADPIFAGKCYSMVLRHLKIRPPSIDPNMYMTRIAKNAGKDPDALSAAVLHTASIKGGDISIVTLRKRALDIIRSIS